jgi:hypothetical protein
MIRLQAPTAMKPQQKTGLAELRSATRPQKSRKLPNVIEYAFCDISGLAQSEMQGTLTMTHVCSPNPMLKSRAMGPVNTKKAEPLSTGNSQLL